MPPKKRSNTSETPKTIAKKSKRVVPFDLDWHDFGSVTNGLPTLTCLYSYSQSGVDKVVALDIDFTVIATKSGKTFSTNGDDWKWLFPSVPEVLKKYDKDGYRIMFFTNQAGLEKGRAKMADVVGKVEGIVCELNIPVFTMVATGENHFRKPATSMWDHFVNDLNKGKTVDIENSIFVGDAAGRPKDWGPGKKKDFSCSDRKFAANIGMPFQTPEEFFLGAKTVKFDWGSFDPKKFLDSHKGDSSKTYHASTPEIIVCVGLPASGKSSFSENYLVPHGYNRVNRDTLKTPAKCEKATEEAAAAGKSVVVDNTNPDKASRATYIKIAKSHKIPVRCFMFETAPELARHLNMVRQNQSRGEMRRVPDVGYNVYKSKYQEPHLDEGFSEIKKIDFCPNFKSEDDKKLFLQWT